MMTTSSRMVASTFQAIAQDSPELAILAVTIQGELKGSDHGGNQLEA
jgi:hypothetical protein